MHRLFTCAHLLASVRVVRNAALAAIAYYIQTSRSRICVSGSLRVPLLSRKRERERERGERKENGVYGGSRRRVAISGALCIYNCTFCPAAADSGSIRRKQVHRTRGNEGRGGATPWVQAISLDHYPVCAFLPTSRKGRKEQKLGIKEEDGREEIKGHNI